MDINKLERLVSSLREDLTEHYGKAYYPYQHAIGGDDVLYARFRETFSHVDSILPDNKTFAGMILRIGTIEDKRAIEACNYILEQIAYEKQSQKRVEEGKLFLGVKEKLMEANNSFKKEDWNSVMNNFSSAVELLLKEKLGIPTTISSIKVSGVIEVLVSEKIGPTKYLEEVKKYILLDNKIKHQGYQAKKEECINALKAAEELVREMDEKPLKISEEVQKKIFREV